MPNHILCHYIFVEHDFFLLTRLIVDNAQLTSVGKSAEKLWMRLLGHAVKKASIFIELYGNQQFDNCRIVQESRFLRESINLRDSYTAKVKIVHHYMTHSYPRKVSKLSSLFYNKKIPTLI